MTNETQSQVNENKNIPFGSRLKSAREALGLERKDAAAQLRLNEKIIVMLEKDKYPSDLPVTFIRGYIRAYGKLLQIPDHEILKAIEPIMPTLAEQEMPPPVVKPISLPSVSSGDYFMQIFTYLIIFTMVGLVGMWWYSHSTQAPQETENQTNASVVPTPQAVTTSTPTTTTQAAPVNPAQTIEPVILPDANKAQTSTSNNQTESKPAAAVTTNVPKPAAANNEPGQAAPHNVDQTKTADASANSTMNNENTESTKPKQAAQDDNSDTSDNADTDTHTNNQDDSDANSDNAD